MKKLMNIVGVLAIAVALTAGFTACTNDDNIVNEQQPTEATAFSVNIPASFDGSQTRAVDFGTDGTSITSTFADGELIYVWLEKSGNYYAGYNRSVDQFTTLTPTGISVDGKKCTLSGTLKFSRYGYSSWEDANPETGNILHLFYRINYPNGYPVEGTEFIYFDQDGSTSNTTGAGSHDFAEATMKVKTVAGNATDGYTLTLCQVADETKTTAQFQNLGSMFRQRLTFTDNNAAAITPAIRKLTISSKNGTLVREFYPFKADKYVRGDIIITSNSNVLSTDGDVWLAMMFNYDATHLADGDQLIVTAQDDNRNIYQCTKNAPATGFAPSKYYYGTMALTWQKQLATPTVTRNDGGAEIVPGNNESIYIDEKDNSTPIDITISGNSDGYDFDLLKAGTVTLSGGGTANYFKDYSYFLRGSGELTVNLDGNYTINCPNNPYKAIYIYGTLKLSGNGTLTVTVKNQYNTGLYGYNNYATDNDHGTDIDASNLAASGYTVTRSARTDNGDGTYTWTYTVAGPPVGAINGKFSVSSTKQVYFSQGNLQAVCASADGDPNTQETWTWQFAANQWDYIGDATITPSGNGNICINGNGSVSAAGTVDLFGWSTSTTTLGINNSPIDNDYCGDFADWGSNATVQAGIGTGWRTLTDQEWAYLIGTRATGVTVNSKDNARYTMATINTDATAVTGLIIFPDAYAGGTPTGVTWGTINAASNFTTTCTTAGWASLETAGCVFLPAAGWRNGATLQNVGTSGFYWSSYSSLSDKVNILRFYESTCGANYEVSRHSGRSVRLVREVQ